MKNEELNRRLSRRGALTLAAGVGAAGAAGLLLRGGTGEALAHGTLVSHDQISGADMIYDSTGAKRADKFNATFYSLCQQWFGFYINEGPAAWRTPAQIRFAGVHVDKAGSCAGMDGSCHSYGRGFDLRHIYVRNAVSGQQDHVFNARYDQWQDDGIRPTLQRQYWATVASLNYHFTYVLHHYDSDTSHRNHIHFDNSVSGSGLGTFSTGRKSQVYSLQAALKHIWGKNIAIDGAYGNGTKTAADQVLDRIGKGGSVTTSAGHWRELNKATFKFAYGSAQY